MAEVQKVPESGGKLNQPESGTTPTASEIDYIASVVQKLIGHIGIRAKVEVTKENEGYVANIKVKHSGAILIGKRGATLKAIQHLVRTIVRREYPKVGALVVDVAGYFKRRDNFLRKKAIAVAKIVTETQREMALDSLTEKEMAVVQEALKAEGLPVRVYAVGVGSRRQVVITPQ